MRYFVKFCHEIFTWDIFVKKFGHSPVFIQLTSRLQGERNKILSYIFPNFHEIFCEIYHEIFMWDIFVKKVTSQLWLYSVDQWPMWKEQNVAMLSSKVCEMFCVIYCVRYLTKDAIHIFQRIMCWSTYLRKVRLMRYIKHSFQRCLLMRRSGKKT